MISPDNQERLEELVAGEILGDLSKDELQEIEALKQADWYADVRQELESTLGRVQLALVGEETEIPLGLRDRIATEAANHVASPDHVRSAKYSNASFENSEGIRDAAVQEHRADSTTAPVPRTASPFGYREALAWIACAAAILVAIGLRNPSIDKPVELSLADMRTALLFEASDIVSADWSAGKHPFDGEVKGDVVWSGDRQEGYMRFVGMPVNDPSKEQYQLWIIDPRRDDEPVDGGVFDISENGEVIIPISAKLGVIEPAAFAITIEKPGGVVVSTQERLPLLAPVEG